MTSRQQFESHYPIPAGVEWSAEEGRYRPVDGKYNVAFHFGQYEAYVSAWGVWQASRAALVVELPAEDGMDGHLWAPDVVEAIEAAGARVQS